MHPSRNSARRRAERMLAQLSASSAHVHGDYPRDGNTYVLRHGESSQALPLRNESVREEKKVSLLAVDSMKS